MRESEAIKREIAKHLNMLDADAVADAIEALVDIRVAEIMDRLSDRLDAAGLSRSP